MPNPANMADTEADKQLAFWNEREWAERLLAVTRDCRTDMHEPDEQDVHAQCVGGFAQTVDGLAYLDGSFDNAMGDEPTKAPTELVVTLTRDIDFDDEGSPTHTQTEHFNLATLVAVARLGAAAIIALGEK